MSISDKVMEAVTKFTLTLVGFLSPSRRRRGRRIVFLSSFNAACVKEGILRENTLKTLNNALSVAEDTGSLDVGFNMAHSIWSQRDIKEMLPGCAVENAPFNRGPDGQAPVFLTLSQAMEFTDNVIRETPDWLRYDQEEMRSDVLDLLIDNEVRVP